MLRAGILNIANRNIECSKENILLPHLKFYAYAIEVYIIYLRAIQNSKETRIN